MHSKCVGVSLSLCNELGNSHGFVCLGGLPSVSS
jgi:hypothetical protein